MPVRPICLALFLLLAAPALAAQQAPSQPAQAAAGVRAAVPHFRVLRSVSGTKGSEQGGRFYMEDPRTIFYVPEDKQVIVYFEWEGPTGPHRFEALWKNPEGKITVISDFAYEADYKQFGGYWTLVLGETMATGLWTLEARVDGEITGTHSFQILAAARPAGEEIVRPPVPLPPAQIYQRAVASTVVIERLGMDGEKLSAGLGFFLGDGILVTAFQSVDGAAGLRLVLPDGRHVAPGVFLAWDRRQNWAVLKTDVSGIPFLPRAAAERTPAVGDRCFTLDVSEQGNRVILPLDIVGKNSLPGAGERFNLSHSFNPGASGGPLLNEFGEVVGVVGSAVLPGASSLEGTKFYYSLGMLAEGLWTGRGLAIPIHMISLASSRRATLAELAAAGLITPPLAAKRDVESGTLAAEVRRVGGLWFPENQKYSFSRRDGKCSALLTLDPQEKREVAATLRIFDLDNRSLGVSKPTKVKLKPGKRHDLQWQIPLANLQPGFYRVDVYFDELPVWRAYMRVTE